MSKELKVEKGIKIEEAAAKKMNPAEMGIATSEAPKDDEVEGQALVHRVVSCPHCGNLGWIWYSTTTYKFYRCGRCGGAFRL